MAAIRKIDRESLADVLRELYEGDVRCVDPCLVYDEDTGSFSIESRLTPREATEHVVCERLCDSWLESDASERRLEIEAAVEKLREEMIARFVTEAMASMDDAYISEYVVGDLESEQE